MISIYVTESTVKSLRYLSPIDSLSRAASHSEKGTVRKIAITLHLTFLCHYTAMKFRIKKPFGWRIEFEYPLLSPTHREPFHMAQNLVGTTCFTIAFGVWSFQMQKSANANMILATGPHFILRVTINCTIDINRLVAQWATMNWANLWLFVTLNKNGAQLSRTHEDILACQSKVQRKHISTNSRVIWRKLIYCQMCRANLCISYFV